MLLPTILLTASSINLVTWSCVPTPMQDSSMRLTPAAKPEHTSSSQRIIRFHNLMVPFSPCPNQQVRYGISRRIGTCGPLCHGKRKKWFPTGKPLLPWGGPNQKALSKQITQPPQVLPIKQLWPAGPKWWICAFGGSIAVHPKTNFIITWMLVLKTGLTTTPNTTRAPTMKPTEVLMQASGT